MSFIVIYAATKEGGHIMDISFCPHHPLALDPDMRSCDCRKPGIGMFLELQKMGHHAVSLCYDW